MNQDNNGIEDLRMGSIVFPNYVSLGKTSKTNHHNDVTIRANIDEIDRKLIVEDFSLMMKNKAFIMECKITEEQLVQMLTFVRKYKSGIYNKTNHLLEVAQ